MKYRMKPVSATYSQVRNKMFIMEYERESSIIRVILIGSVTMDGVKI